MITSGRLIGTWIESRVPRNWRESKMIAEPSWTECTELLEHPTSSQSNSWTISSGMGWPMEVAMVVDSIWEQSFKKLGLDTEQIYHVLQETGVNDGTSITTQNAF